MHQQAAGNTLAEYGMIAGLVLCVGWAGLQLLGQDVGQLINTPGAKLQSNQMQAYVNMKFTGNTPLINVAGKNAIMQFNAASLTPTIQLTETAAHGTNATSIDGNMQNAMASTALAQKLDALADKITDPALATWYQKVSRMAHLLAGAEGDHENVQTLQIQTVKTGGEYVDGSAYRDIYNYQKQLQLLLSQPPVGGNGKQIQMVSQLGVEVWNNAQPFTYAVSSFVQNDGTLNLKALASSPLGLGMSNDTYDQLVSDKDLQTNVNTVVATNSAAGNAGLQATVVDAQKLQTASN